MVVMVQGNFMIYLHITFGKLSNSDRKGKIREERREREGEGMKLESRTQKAGKLLGNFSSDRDGSLSDRFQSQFPRYCSDRQ